MSNHKWCYCTRIRDNTCPEDYGSRGHRGEPLVKLKSTKRLQGTLTMRSSVEKDCNPSSQPDENSSVEITYITPSGKRRKKTLPKDPFKE